jgi:protein-S-isoprenylcysteine O-methyltransferase Ste14
MKRNKAWIARWGSFLTGVCIGLLIVAPVLAISQFPFAENGVSPPQWFQSAQSLLDVVALLGSVAAMRHFASTRSTTQRKYG